MTNNSNLVDQHKTTWSYFRGVASGTLGVAAVSGMGFATVWVLNRATDKETFGAFTIALTLISIVELVLSGIPTNIIMFRVSRLESEDGSGSGSVVVNPLVSIFGTLAVVSTIMFVMYGWLSDSMEAPEKVEFWLLVLSPLLIFRVLRNILTTWLRANRQVARASLMGQSSVALLTIVLLATAFAFNAAAWVLGLAIIVGLAIPTFLIFLSRPIRPTFSFAGITRWDLGYGLKLMLNAAVGRLILNSDILFLGVMTSVEVTAEYAVASRIAFLLPTGIRSIVDVFAPRMGLMLQRSEHTAVDAEHRAVQVGTTVIGLTFSIFVIVVGKELLGFFGEYSNSYDILLILLCAQLIPVFFSGNIALLTMMGKGGWFLSSSVAALVVNAGLNLVLIPAIGANGAAVSSLAAYVVMHVIISTILYRSGGLTIYSMDILLVMVTVVPTLALVSSGFVPITTGAITVLFVFTLFAIRNRTQVSRLFGNLWLTKRARQRNGVGRA